MMGAFSLQPSDFWEQKGEKNPFPMWVLGLGLLLPPLPGPALCPPPPHGHCKDEPAPLWLQPLSLWWVSSE